MRAMRQELQEPGHPEEPRARRALGAGHEIRVRAGRRQVLDAEISHEPCARGAHHWPLHGALRQKVQSQRKSPYSRGKLAGGQVRALRGQVCADVNLETAF